MPWPTRRCPRAPGQPTDPRRRWSRWWRPWSAHERGPLGPFSAPRQRRGIRCRRQRPEPHGSALQSPCRLPRGRARKARHPATPACGCAGPHRRRGARGPIRSPPPAAGPRPCARSRARPARPAADRRIRHARWPRRCQARTWIPPTDRTPPRSWLKYAALPRRETAKKSDGIPPAWRNDHRKPCHSRGQRAKRSGVWCSCLVLPPHSPRRTRPQSFLFGNAVCPHSRRARRMPAHGCRLFFHFFQRNVMDNRDIVKTLNSLIETSKDGEYGFRLSAEHARGEQIKLLFLARAGECAQAASELQTLVLQYGGKAETSGSATGSLHRGWVAVKGTLAGYSDLNMLEEAERGEDAALEQYRNALRQVDLPGEVRSLVERQFQGAKDNHDQIRDLREQARASSH